MSQPLKIIRLGKASGTTGVTTTAFVEVGGEEFTLDLSAMDLDDLYNDPTGAEDKLNQYPGLDNWLYPVEAIEPEESFVDTLLRVLQYKEVC